MVELLLVLAALGCGGDPDPMRVNDAGPGADVGLEGDAGAVDGGAELDAGGDAAEPDAGGEIDAGSPDGGPVCVDACPLTDNPDTCSDSGHACRIRGCSTHCGEVAPARAQYGDDCVNEATCDRDLQCLARPTSGEGTCYAFCRVGHDEDCETLGGPSATCSRLTDLRTIDDDEPVVLPVGVGVCS